MALVERTFISSCVAAIVKHDNDLAENNSYCSHRQIMPDRMNAYDISLERSRLRVVIATVVINIVAVSLLAFAPWSDWRTGVARLVDYTRTLDYSISPESFWG
jgi:hypothetical protein